MQCPSCLKCQSVIFTEINLLMISYVSVRIRFAFTPIIEAALKLYLIVRFCLVYEDTIDRLNWVFILVASTAFNYLISLAILKDKMASAKETSNLKNMIDMLQDTINSLQSEAVILKDGQLEFSSKNSRELLNLI